MVDRDELTSALAHLRQRATAEDDVRLLSTTTPKPSTEDSGERQVHARHMIKLVQALRAAQRLTFPEYVYQASVWCEMIVDDRVTSGAFASELQPIEDAIRDIEREQGLLSGEFWLRDEGPDEWQQLNVEFEAVLEGKLHEALREHGLGDIADLATGDPAAYARMQDDGWRALRKGDFQLDELDRLITVYVEESQAAERAGAWYAAVVMRGAALEGLLLRKCLERSAETVAARELLPVGRRPSGDMSRWTLAQLIDVAFAAGWLPKLPIDDEYVVSTRPLADLIRRVRNLLHAGRHVSDRMSPTADISTANDARAALTLIQAVLEQL